MPIYPGDSGSLTCSLCNESINLTWICPQCHKVFCDDCVDLQTKEEYICLTCQSKEYEVDKRGRRSCRNCGSHDFQSFQDAATVCRNCGSDQITRIEDLQDSLISDYKTIINQTRKFIEPVNNLVDTLNGMRTKLYQLRKDHPQCLHYPTLESKILMIVNLFDTLKNELYEETFHFFQEIQRNIHYVAEIQITHPTNLIHISQVLEFFERERTKVQDFAQSKFSTLDTKLDRLYEKIHFMESVQANFMKHLGKLNLDPDETIVYFQNCKLSSGENESKEFSNKSGTIMLTSKRLHFLHEQGFFRKQTAVLFTVRLEDIQSTDVKGKLIKKVTLESLNSFYDFRLPKHERDQLLDWIERARQFESRNQIDEDNWKKLNRAKINASMFYEQLEQAIYELIGFHGSNTRNQGFPTGKVVNSEMYRTRQLPRRSSSYSSPSYSHTNKPMSMHRSPLVEQGFHNGDSFKHHDRFQTPDGHFGYPHDKRTVHDSSYSAQGNYRNQMPTMNSRSHLSHSGSDRLPGQQWRNKIQFSPSSHMNGFSRYSSEFSQIPPSQESPFSHTFTPKEYNTPSPNPSSSSSSPPIHSFPPQPPASSQSSDFQQGVTERQLKEELHYYYQEEFALKNTVKRLEQSYETGNIPPPDFIKNYQDLQRKLFKISTHIRELENALRNPNHDSWS